MGFRHVVRVRYGECDMQKVVFNANYLAYIDDAVDTWFRTVFAPEGSFEELGFDFMVKRIELEWQSPARFGETHRARLLGLTLGHDVVRRDGGRRRR